MTNSCRTRIFILCSLSAAIAASCRGSEGTGNSADLDCSELPPAPILFVHGSGLTSDTWHRMIGEFRQAGYPSDFLLAIDLVPDDGDNIAAAKADIARAVVALNSTAQQTRSRYGCPEMLRRAHVDIVAHSMGAVSSRWYAKYVSPESVRTLVTVAGANHGTNALCGRPGIGDSQLCPAFAISADLSGIQIALNGVPGGDIDETPYSSGPDPSHVKSVYPTRDRHITYFSIRLDPDRWIVPSESAILSGAGSPDKSAERFPALRETSPGNFLFRRAVPHDDLPMDQEIIEFVRYLLN